MNYYVKTILKETFVSGSEISVFDLIASAIGYIARSAYWELICTPLFGGSTEEYDDDEGYGTELYSRFGKYAGSYYYWCKKVNRGEVPETYTALDVPLLCIECRVKEWRDEEDVESCYGANGLKEYKLIRNIVKGEFLTMRGVINLSMAFIPDINDDDTSISVSDEDEPPEENVLDTVVKQNPPEKKKDDNPKTREECRKSGLFKAVSDGLSSVQQKDIIAYSTLTGVFAAGDPAFLYIDESLKGKDLPDFISVSCGGFPSDFGLGDNNSVYRVRLFDGLTSKCLKHIHYYDKLPEDMRHYLPHTSTPPMVGC